MTTETAASGGVGLGRGGRMSRQRKRDAVVHLLRGEDLEILSRALGVTAATLTGWRDTFVAAGEASLATRSTDGEALETERLKAKLGRLRGPLERLSDLPPLPHGRAQKALLNLSEILGSVELHQRPVEHVFHRSIASPALSSLSPCARRSAASA